MDNLVLELQVDETINSLENISTYVNNIRYDSSRIKELVTKINGDWKSNSNDIDSITNALVEEINKADNNVIPNMESFINSMNELLEKYI